MKHGNEGTARGCRARRGVVGSPAVAGVLALVLAGLGVLCGAIPASATTTGHVIDVDFNDALGTGFDGTVTTVVPVEDGYLVGGLFDQYQGTPVNGLVRLNEDLSLNTDFMDNLGTGFNSAVRVVVPVDGGYLVGGTFTQYQGTHASRLVLLNEDLSLNTDFTDNLGTGFNSDVSAVVPEVSGYLVAGPFTQYQGTPVGGLVRLNEDLSLNTDFNDNLGTGFSSGVGFASAVAAMAPVDGGYVVGGAFTHYQDTPIAGRLVRLNEDLSLNTDFNDNLGTGFNGPVYAVMPVDGGYVVGGAFGHYQDTPARRLVRLNEDLSLNTDFNDNLGTGFSNSVHAVVPVDGGHMVGGYFTHYQDTPAANLVRLVSVAVTAGHVTDRSDAQGVEIAPQQLTGDVAPVGVAGPVAFSVAGLPPGLSLDADSGQITGTPTTSGTYPVQVTATVPGGVADSTAFDWTIQQVAPSITGTAVDGVVGQAFSFVPVLDGVPDPMVTSVGLPDWAQLDASTGAVTGTPTAPGPVRFTLTASNGTAPEATLDVAFDVVAAPKVEQLWAELEHAERAPGQTQSVVGGGFVPGDRAAVVMNSRTVDLGTVVADGQGRVALSFVVPADTEAGLHTITLTGSNGTTSTTFTVTGDDTGQGALAQTGANTLTTVMLAVLVILLGTTLARMTRAGSRTRA